MSTKPELLTALRALGIEMTDSRARKTPATKLSLMLAEAQAKVVKVPAGKSGKPRKRAEPAHPTASETRKDTRDVAPTGVDLDQDPTPDEPKRTRAAASVVSIDAARKPAMNREPRSAALFRPTAPGSKRALMAELVLRPTGATVEELMGVTGWSRSTTVSAIAYDLVSQMGLGMRREGDRYHGSLPAGVKSHLRDVAPVKMAANKK